MKPELFKDVPEDTVPIVSDGGCINRERFVDRLKHSAEYAKPAEDDVVDSHMSIAVSKPLLFAQSAT
jgi:hypothetical protein